MIAAALVAATLAAAPSGSAGAGSTDPRLEVLSAMQAELSRSMERLRLQGYDTPYFIAYQVKDSNRYELLGRYGALFQDDARHDRSLYADVRVGSYAFDSSAPEEPFVLGSEQQSWYAPREAPLDGDTSALRNALWLATDERYKEALSSYFRKRSQDVYRQDLDGRAPSFTREPPVRHVDEAKPFPLDRDRWRAAVRAVSAAFRAYPTVFDSSLKVMAEKEVRWFASSEGSGLVTESIIYGVHLLAAARAPDGQLLEDSRDFYARAEGDLPSTAQLLEAVRDLAGELEALRAAPVIDPYTGPAILDPEATGVLFHEAIGHRLEGERLDDEKEGQTFKGQIGRPVLPSFLSIVDDPTLAEVGGVSLNGAYTFDDQGVPAQRTMLVKDGRLESYLLSRKPVLPAERSNGHGRSQGGRAPTARMASLFVVSKKGVSRDELKRMLMAEARHQGKPYALVIRDITGGNTNTMSYGYQAFKGTPRLVYRIDAKTGKEQLVRGVELVGTPLSSVNKVLATTKDVRVFNGYCGAESGYVPVSTVAPFALIGEIELQRVGRPSERSPILPAPWSEKDGPAAPPSAPAARASGVAR
jgi:predicted Zn-dependent protease